MSGIDVDDRIRDPDDLHATAGITSADLEEFKGLPVSQETMQMVVHKVRHILERTSIITHAEIKDGWIKIWFSYDSQPDAGTSGGEKHG